MPTACLLPLATQLVITSAAAGPTLAIEDTLHTAVPEVLVRAPRVTLAEILDRVAGGEARRESLLTDQTFTAVVRLVRQGAGRQPPRLVEESVWRVYRKRPGRVRSILLRRRGADERGPDSEVRFQRGMDEQIVNFAFRPQARRDYRYRIVGRDVIGDHVVYRVAFEPRFPFHAFEPSGLVWIDTNEFVIARQELRFPRSPVPLVIRGIERVVIERQKVDGHWVLGRVLLRARTTVPMPRLGRWFDFAIQYRDYALNTGLDDAVFEAAQ